MGTLNNSLQVAQGDYITSIGRDAYGHVNSVVGSSLSWEYIPDRPTVFPPSTHTHSLSSVNNGTASRAVITTSGGVLTTSNVTSTEINYLDGVTSSIQLQLNGKLNGAAQIPNGVLISNSSGQLTVYTGVSPTELSMLADINTNGGITVQAQLNGKLGNSGNQTISGGSLTATNFILSSDVRLKSHVKELPNALNKIKALRGVSFEWKESGVADVGIIAQELETVLPEAVFTDEKGFKTVAYNKIIALLIEAVKELSNG